MRVYIIFTWTVDIKNPLYESEDIQQLTILPNSHENLILPGEFNSWKLIQPGIQPNNLIAL